jgi:hypothetical protein
MLNGTGKHKKSLANAKLFYCSILDKTTKEVPTDLSKNSFLI